MGSLKDFCDAMRWAADSDQVGYSQSDRCSLGPGDFFGSGLYNTDCSALTVAALKYAGFETGWASYTGNMSDALCANGWVRLSPGVDLSPGDILLNDANHVAVWLGDCLAQASYDEHGDIAGGARGDQTGSEVNTRSFYSYPWNCVLRYSGDSDCDGTSSGPAVSGATSNGSVGCGWQGDMVGRHDEAGGSDDYAGIFGKPILAIAIDGVGEYQVSDTVHGDFWPKVDRYDLDDPENGYAGDKRPIDRIRIFDPTVSYQLHEIFGDWYPVMKGTRDTGGSSDDFAGEKGVQFDLLRIWRDEGDQPRYNVYS